MKDSSKLQSQEPLPDPLREGSLKHRPEARIIEEAMPAAVLAAVAGPALKQVVSNAAFKSYLDKVLEDSGNPTDPLERQWLEQEAWAHFSIGNLLAKAAAAASPELVVALTVAATRLMAEHRKHGLALREYRSPIAPKQVTVVRQQNVAGGDQQIALIEGKPEVTAANADTELGSNQARLNHVEFNDPFAKAASRPAELVEAQGPHRQGTSEATANGHCESAVEALDRPQDGRGQGSVSG